MDDQEAQQIRAALKGTRMLIVGGDPSPKTIQRLKSSLSLRQVIHCPTRKSDASARRFQFRLHDQYIALVVCARGLTRTEHGKTLHALCRGLEVPLLNCYHIPHPNNLVASIAKARLTMPLVEHCAFIKNAAVRVIGSAS